jgi:hypothetical protein
MLRYEYKAGLLLAVYQVAFDGSMATTEHTDSCISWASLVNADKGGHVPCGFALKGVGAFSEPSINQNDPFLSISKWGVSGVTSERPQVIAYSHHYRHMVPHKGTRCRITPQDHMKSHNEVA